MGIFVLYKDMEVSNINGKDYLTDIFKAPIEVGDVLYRCTHSGVYAVICVKVTKNTIYTLVEDWKWDATTRHSIRFIKAKREQKYANFINCTKLGQNIEVPVDILAYYQENYLTS